MTATNPLLTTNLPTPTASSPERMVRGIGLIYFTTAIQLFLRLALTVLIGRMLGTVGLGVFSLGFITVQALTMLAVNGQDMGLVKFVAPAYHAQAHREMRGLLDVALIAALSAAFVLAVGMALVFPTFIFNSTGSASAASVAPWFAPAIVLQTASSILGAYAVACGRIRVRAYAERIFGSGAQLLVTAVLLWLGWDLWGVVVGQLALAIVTLIVTLIMVFDLIPLRVHVIERGSAFRKLYGHSWKIGLANAVNYILSNAALFILGALSATQAGLFAAASRLTTPGSLFMDAFGTNFAPHAAGKLHDPTLARDYQRMTLWMIVLSAPIFIVLFAFAPQWIGLLGPEFAAGVPVLMVLAAARFLDMFTGNAGILISLSNRPQLRILNTILIWGSNLILLLVLAPTYGVLGAAFAFLFAIVLTDILEYFQVQSIYRFSPWSNALLKPLTIILLSTCILTFLNLRLELDLRAAISGALVFGAVYVGLMWRVGLPPADVQMLTRGVRRYVLRRGQS